jgi:hypothetical protein
MLGTPASGSLAPNCITGTELKVRGWPDEEGLHETNEERRTHETAAKLQAGARASVTIAMAAAVCFRYTQGR